LVCPEAGYLRPNGGAWGAQSLDVRAQRREHESARKKNEITTMRSYLGSPSLDVTLRCVRAEHRTPVAPLKSNLAATEFGLKIKEQR